MTTKSLLEGKKVLLVDDEPDVLEALADLLPMCDLVKASTFDEAKKLLETQPFDIAILDIMGVQGYVLLEISNEKKVIAVMLTAHAMTPDNVLKSYNEGAASFVPKEKMANIAVFLNDILEAQEKGKSLWWRWYDRLADYFEKKFGPDWQKESIINTCPLLDSITAIKLIFSLWQKNCGFVVLIFTSLISVKKKADATYSGPPFVLA